jgi:hypothetical protein
MASLVESQANFPHPQQIKHWTNPLNNAHIAVKRTAHLKAIQFGNTKRTLLILCLLL